MAMTRIAPSRSAATTLCTAISMKSDCRKMWLLIFMPGGRVFWMSASTASSWRVSWSVFAVGCFWMPRITAGFALCEPSPRLSAAPICTVGHVAHEDRLAVALDDHRGGDVVGRA